MQSRPKISVITVVKNAAGTIADTMQSIRYQSQPSEHVIIDGVSTDGTLEMLGRLVASTTKLISEPDDGTYAAMNKGIAIASGEIVGILNADDYYAHENVLASVVRVFEDPDVQSCYGDLIYIDPRRSNRILRVWKAGPFGRDRFFLGWMPPHPTFFVRRSVYERFGGFNLALGTAADYEWMLRVLMKEKISSRYIPEVLVIMRAGGLSNSSLSTRIRVNRLDREAWLVNGLKPRPWTLICKPLLKVGQYVYKGPLAKTCSSERWWIQNTSGKD